MKPKQIYYALVFLLLFLIFIFEPFSKSNHEWIGSFEYDRPNPYVEHDVFRENISDVSHDSLDDCLDWVEKEKLKITKRYSYSDFKWNCHIYGWSMGQKRSITNKNVYTFHKIFPSKLVYYLNAIFY